MNYKRSKKLFSVMCYLCIALVLASSILRIRWLSAAGLGVLALGFLQMVLFYKCPHCGAQLEPRGPVPKFCPNCGKELD